MSDVYLDSARQAVERHAREAAECDVRDGRRPTLPGSRFVFDAVLSWAWNGYDEPDWDLLETLTDYWKDAYDVARAEWEASIRHVVRWADAPGGGDWTLGLTPDSPALTPEEAQSLYENGAIVMIGDAISGPVRTDRSPLQVERDLA
jgi:hypothetical protein